VIKRATNNRALRRFFLISISTSSSIIISNSIGNSIGSIDITILKYYGFCTVDVQKMCLYLYEVSTQFIVIFCAIPTLRPLVGIECSFN